MSENLVSKAFIEFLIAVSVPSESKFCPDCGTELHHLNSTFFFEEQSWQVLYPSVSSATPPNRSLRAITPDNSEPNQRNQFG